MKYLIKTVKVKPKYPEGQTDKGINGLSSKEILFSLACPYMVYFTAGTFPKGKAPPKDALHFGDVSQFSIDGTVISVCSLKK